MSGWRIGSVNHATQEGLLLFWQCSTGLGRLLGFPKWTPRTQTSTSPPLMPAKLTTVVFWVGTAGQTVFHAYRDNQCGMATPAETADSCCQLGWQCTIPSDWILGKAVYADFNGQCKIPIQEVVEGVILEGTEAYIVRVKEALNLLKSRAPEWYAYVIRGPLKIRENYFSGASGTLERSVNMHTFHVGQNVHDRARFLVHESCHVHRWLAGLLRYETDQQVRLEESLRASSR